MEMGYLIRDPLSFGTGKHCQAPSTLRKLPNSLKPNRKPSTKQIADELWSTCYP
jgi:hypothetical protein